MPHADSSAGPLFSTELISPEVLKSLPEGYSCRPLEKQDYHKGFLDVLRVLTTVGDITEEVGTRKSPSFIPRVTHCASSTSLTTSICAVECNPILNQTYR